MKNAFDMTLAELKTDLTENGFKPFRAAQVYKWMTKYTPVSEMSDLSNADREKLAAAYDFQPVKIADRLVSKDKSVKYIFLLSDGNVIEGALMKQGYGNTICVSTQVGCRMGCAFCASGIGGVVRNLTPGEMLAEVLAVNADLGKTEEGHRNVTNIVLMGSGEPLDNYENVTKFLSLVSCPDGINISQRNITLSTCGLADRIRKLADDGFLVNITISLHATTDEIRKTIMPIAYKYSIDEIIDACNYYAEKTGRRTSFEYTMIKSSNMGHFDALRLTGIAKRAKAHINLIMLNYVKEKNVKGCTEAEAQKFCKKLTDAGVNATIRRSKGGDVGGACGQLRRKYMENAHD